METTSNRVSFVSFDKPFNFAELVNFGVSQARGSHVVLMNNDIEVINGDWLSCMLEHSQRAEIGAVGGKLYYPSHIDELISDLEENDTYVPTEKSTENIVSLIDFEILLAIIVFDVIQ